MRILYHHRTLADGAEGVHIREMVQAFRARGHEVRVAALVGEPAESLAHQRSRWSGVSRILPSVVYEMAEIAYNSVGRRSLDRAVREFKPDFIYDRYNTYSTAALRVARLHGLPLLLEVNGPVAYERIAYKNKQLRMPALAIRYERSICQSANHVFAVSTPLARFLTDERGVNPGRLTVLPNGANPVTFHPGISADALRSRLALAPGRVVVGFVGILRPWHGVDMLLVAIQRLVERGHDLHLLVVGDGPIEEDLRLQADAAGLNRRVTFTGRVAHADVRNYVALMDVAVSPKATFYASPMKILEYMAMAKAVVAPAMDNIVDLIRNDDTGLLFRPDDANDLERALERLVSSRERRDQTGRAARQEVEQRRNWAANADIVTQTAKALLMRRTRVAS